MKSCPDVVLTLMVDGGVAHDRPISSQDFAAARCTSATVRSRRVVRDSHAVFVGDDGRPKGIVRPLPESHPSEMAPLFAFLNNLWQYREDMVYLSPAPLYHSAPQAAVNLTCATAAP